MDSQSRLLQILKYLYDHTDADHDISSKDIIQMLESRDSEAPDRRTIESDVDALISSGHDIVRASIGPTFYGWLFQYAGKMTLAGPQEAVDDYNKHRKKATKGPKDNRCK